MSRVANLDCVLDDIEEYLEGREDVVDGSYGEPAPNQEMTLLRELRLSRAALRSQRGGAVKALESIAANTCCGSCQEAALVARAALARTDCEHAYPPSVCPICTAIGVRS